MMPGFGDGSMGARTAFLREPYLLPFNTTNRGFMISKPSDLERWTQEADLLGLQVNAYS